MSRRNCYLGNKLIIVSHNTVAVAWVIINLVYMFGLKISRPMLAESIVSEKCIVGHISIYKGGAAENFKDLDTIMMFYLFKKYVMWIED